MGAYVYKVSTKPVGRFNGKPVYPSTFGYKPWTGWSVEAERVNRIMAFRSGCVSVQSAWRKKSEQEDLSRIYVLFGTAIIEIGAWGIFVDDALLPEDVVGSLLDMEVTSRAHLTKLMPTWEQTVVEGRKARQMMAEMA